MGYWVDTETSQLRPVNGIPGAAVIGAALAGETRWAQFESARNGNWGVGILADDRAVVFLDLSGTEARQIGRLEGPPADQVALSPKGRYAVVSAAGRVRVVGPLPGAAEVKWEAPAQAGNIPAVDDEGTRVLIAGSDGLYSLRQGDAAPVLLAPGVRATALRFLPARSEAVFVDGAAAWMIGPDDGSSPALLRDDLAGAFALADDGQGALLVALPNAVALVNLTTRETRRIECECTVALLAPMLNHSAFRLNEPGAENAARVLDLGPSEPRMLLLPPPARGDAAAAGEGGAQ
jgi:hypothetical protein